MENLADNLYIELVITAIILMLITFYNNMTLYKIKISDILTQMVVFTVFLCASDLTINLVQYRPEFTWLNYISQAVFTVSSLAVGSLLLKYIMVKLDCDIKRKWQTAVLFYIPNLFIFFVCASTPWTKLIYYTDENGIMEAAWMYYLFIALFTFYVLLAIVISLVAMFRSSKGDTEERHTAVTMLIFAGLILTMHMIAVLIFGSDSDYISNGLVWAVSLVYLTTNMNMNTLIENRTREAAVRTDLEIAAKIQTGAMPKVFPPYEHHPEIELFASMDTAKEVGGDFYDCFEIDEKRVCFIMADVSGKGIPAALFMMTAKTMIKDCAMLKGNTAEIFTTVNKYLSLNNETGMFATAWIGIIDTESLTLQYTNAGHNYPYIAHSGEDFEILKKTHGLFLAGMDDTEYRKDELQLKKGDTLFIYTDGLTEAHNVNDELYTAERLNELLNRTSDRGGKSLLPEIKHSVDDFAGGREQFDDITMMVINIK